MYSHFYKCTHNISPVILLTKSAYKIYAYAGGEGADYGQYAYAASYDAGPPIAQPEVPKVRFMFPVSYTNDELFQIADDFCPPGFDLPGFGLLSQCVAINQCSELLNNANAPLNQTLPCGFDKKQSMMKICCPTAYVTQPQVSRERITLIEVGAAFFH